MSDIEKREDIRAMRRDIEATRRRISGEVEELSERLTPEHAKQAAKEKLVEAKDRAISRVSDRAQAVASSTVNAGRRAGDVVRDNPIPAAMVAVGAGWLVWEAVRSPRRLEPVPERIEGPGWPPTRSRYERGRERAKEKALDVRDRAANAYSSASESVRSTALSAKGRAGELYDRGRNQANQAYVRSQDAYDTNPIAFGAVALLAGIGLGMMLPHTEREDRLMGERRQKVFDRARTVASEAKDVAIESAKEGAKVARDRAREEARKNPDLPSPR